MYLCGKAVNYHHHHLYHHCHTFIATIITINNKVLFYLIYVTGILIENHLISGTELGAEGTMTTKDKPLYSGRFMVWGGVRETDIKQIIYTLKQL